MYSENQTNSILSEQAKCHFQQKCSCINKNREGLSRGVMVDVMDASHIHTYIRTNDYYFLSVWSLEDNPLRATDKLELKTQLNNVP